MTCAFATGQVLDIETLRD